MIDSYSRTRQKKGSDSIRQHWEVDVKNLPEHMKKQDIAYFIWKSLESCNALTRNGNPIIQITLQPGEKTLRLNFRSEEEALNCLQLNQIYLVQKEQLREKNLLRSFIDDTKDTTSSSCYCQYVSDEQTQQALKKLDNSKLKGRSVIAKRATLMKTKQSSKTKISTISKGTRFQSLDQMYMTFDSEGFFKNKKISCVLILKGILPLTTNLETVLKDIKTQVEKIGPLVRFTHKNHNVYLQYERVEYSQIAYLLISKRKYDGKDIEVLFYDPIKFADDILI